MLYIDGSGPIASVEVFGAAALAISAPLVEMDCSGIFSVHMQPEGKRFVTRRGFLEAQKQRGSNSLSAPFWQDFDRRDIRSNSIRLLRPLDDGKARHASRFACHPGSRVGGFNKLPHVATAETFRCLEANLLNGIEFIEVAGLVEAVLHESAGLLSGGAGTLRSDLADSGMQVIPCRV